MKRDPDSPSRRAPPRTPLSRLVPNSPPVAPHPELPSRVSSRTPLPSRPARPLLLRLAPDRHSTLPRARHAPLLLERTQTEPSTERIQTEPSSSATTLHSPLAVAVANRPAPRPLWSSLSRSSLKLSLPSPRRSSLGPSSIDHRILVLLANPLRPFSRPPQTIHSDARPGSPPIYQQTGSPTHRHPLPNPCLFSAPPAPLATRLPLSR